MRARSVIHSFFAPSMVRFFRRDRTRPVLRSRVCCTPHVTLPVVGGLRAEHAQADVCAASNSMCNVCGTRRLLLLYFGLRLVTTVGVVGVMLLVRTRITKPVRLQTRLVQLGHEGAPGGGLRRHVCPAYQTQRAAVGLHRRLRDSNKRPETVRHLTRKYRRLATFGATFQPTS